MPDRPRPSLGGVLLRVFLGLCVGLPGAVWLSTPLWPVDPTAEWPFVAELQASAFLGGVALAVGVTLLLSLRRRSLGAFAVAAAVGVVGLALCVAVPRIPVPSEDAGTAGSTPDHGAVRVLAFNTYFQAAEDQKVAELVQRVRPDVMFLSETDEQEASRVAAASGMVSLTPVEPGAVGPPGRHGPAGVATLASPAYLARIGAVAQLVPGVTVFQLPQLTAFPGTAHQERFLGVHSVAPTGPARQQWVGDIARLRQWVAGHGRLDAGQSAGTVQPGATPAPSGQPQPATAGRPQPATDGQQPATSAPSGQNPEGKLRLVMAGDFNSTRGHPGFRALLSEAGMRSCTGYLAHRPTWPSNSPVIRLDHILTTGQCLGGGAERIAGSDHLAIWADVTT